MMIVDCQTCRSAGHLSCRCTNDGVLKPGQTARFSLMMKDHAGSQSNGTGVTTRDSQTQRKALNMMTDAEIRTMRDSVRGMPLQRAVTLPIYDGVRGCVTNGRPAEEHFAIMDGAEVNVLGSLPVTDESIRIVADERAAYYASVQALNRHRR